MTTWLSLILLTTNLAGFEYHSEARQDTFAHLILYSYGQKQNPGIYLEIGCGDPLVHNNTYFFEKNYQWTGLSIDISATHTDKWSTLRSNPFLCQNALQCNYSELLKSFPRDIDYLSLDIDGAYDQVLLMLPFEEHIFKVITIEHDFYRYGGEFRSREREILSAKGYYLLCPDVKIRGLSFEDWWIHPTAVSPETFFTLFTLNIKDNEHTQIIQTLLESQNQVK